MVLVMSKRAGEVVRMFNSLLLEVGQANEISNRGDFELGGI